MHWRERRKFLRKTAQDVIDANGCHPFFGISIAAKVSTAVDLMFKHSLWRLGVERSGTLISVLTTSDIIAYCGSGSAVRPDQPTAKIPREILSLTVAELAASGLAPRARVGAVHGFRRNSSFDGVRRLSSDGSSSGVAIVGADEPLLRCFIAMRKDDSVGVVSADGSLFGVVSAWDLKFLNHHSLVALSQPTRAFLRTVRQAMMAPDNYLVNVTIASTVEVLLKKFHDHHVDQIYVVDEKSAPVGLVTVHDLLRVLQS